MYVSRARSPIAGLKSCFSGHIKREKNHYHLLAMHTLVEDERGQEMCANYFIDDINKLTVAFKKVALNLA